MDVENLIRCVLHYYPTGLDPYNIAYDNAIETIRLKLKMDEFSRTTLVRDFIVRSKKQLPTTTIYNRSLEAANPCITLLVHPFLHTDLHYTIVFNVSILAPYYYYYVNVSKQYSLSEQAPIFFKYFKKGEFISEEKWDEIYKKEGAPHLAPSARTKTYLNECPTEISSFLNAIVECQKDIFNYSHLSTEIGNIVIQNVHTDDTIRKRDATIFDLLFSSTRF